VPLLRTARAEAFLNFNANGMNTVTTVTKSNLQDALKSYANAKPASLRSAVAIEALEYHDPKIFFNDLLQHGCISGMVSSLVYYTDTHAFFDQHYQAIENLRDEVEDNLGEPLQVKGDLKNFMAWFAFEETAYQIALELGLMC